MSAEHLVVKTDRRFRLPRLLGMKDRLFHQVQRSLIRGRTETWSLDEADHLPHR